MLKQQPISAIGGLTLPAIPDRMSGLLLSLQYQLEESQWWTKEEMEAHQFSQLAIVLRHARETVPYYRELLAAIDLRPGTRIDRGFLESLPISHRQGLQEAGERLISASPPKEHGAPTFGTTSGSTGRAFRFGRTTATQTIWAALALRDLLWHDRDMTGKLCAIRYAPKGVADAPHGRRTPRWGIGPAGFFRTGPGASLSVTATLAQQLAWLRQEKPDYLVAFPSNLAALCRYARDHQEKLLPLRELRTIGETLTPEVRRQIRETWGVRIIDTYSCEEAGYLALQCPQHEHYHVQSESVVLEIVDEAGRPCPPGVTGRVLLTSLNNFLTPLIRYEVGDYAEFGEPCPCGRGLPVLRRIHGRRRNRLILPDGNSLFPYLGEHGGIARATGVEVHQFQFVQHTVGQVELKLVMERPLTEAEQEKVRALVRRNFGHPFEILLTFHSEIPRGANGKFEEFICLVGSDAAPEMR